MSFIFLIFPICVLWYIIVVCLIVLNIYIYLYQSIYTCAQVTPLPFVLLFNLKIYIQTIHCRKFLNRKKFKNKIETMQYHILKITCTILIFYVGSKIENAVTLFQHFGTVITSNHQVWNEAKKNLHEA